jgi:hypothetical protein
MKTRPFRRVILILKAGERPSVAQSPAPDLGRPINIFEQVQPGLVAYTFDVSAFRDATPEQRFQQSKAAVRARVLHSVRRLRRRNG